MREGGVLTELHSGAAAGRAKRGERRADVLAQFDMRHAFLQRGQSGTEGHDRDVVGALHQGDLRGRLEHPATGRHRSRQGQLHAGWQGSTNALRNEEPHALFQADLAARHAAVLEDARHEGAPVFVFLPDPDVVAEGGNLARALLFKRRRHVGQVAFLRDDQEKRALAEAPAHAGEILHARAVLEHQGGNALLSHQLPRFFDARHALRFGNRRGGAGKRRQRRDGRRHTGRTGRYGGRGRRRRRATGGGGQGCRGH
jgi:hypothetical protein